MRPPLLRLGDGIEGGTETARSDLADGAGVLCDLAVGGEQRDAFDHRLSDEQAVEGVFVDWRQVLDGECVLARNGEFEVTVGEEILVEEARVDPELDAAARTLDCNLPQTCSAHIEFVGRVVHKLASAWWQLVKDTSGPQQEVCVDQQVHSSSLLP